MARRRLLLVEETPVCKLPFRGADGATVWLKDETKQPSGSFKLRGASFKLSRLTEIDCVVTASTGNHGIAVAQVAQRQGRHATVFVPAATPARKLHRLIEAGASVQFVEGDYESAFTAARSHARSNGLPFVPSFDDIDIISGHQTLYQELDEQCPHLNCLFVPVGGGGLLAAAVIHYAERPVRIIGVEAEWAPKLLRSLQSRARIELPPVSGIAEGLQTRSIGLEPLRVLLPSSVRVVLVNRQEIFAAMAIAWRECGIRAEPAGAAALAAALRGCTVQDEAVCIVSGGNVDNDLFNAALAAR